MRLWFLAFLGSTLSWLGDVLVVQAARDGRPSGMFLPVLLFAAAAPVWYLMSKLSGGSFVAPAIAWNVLASVLSLGAVLYFDGHQSPRQWAGLGLLFLGLLVRG